MKIGTQTANAVDKSSSIFEALNQLKHSPVSVSRQLVQELYAGGIQNPALVPGRLYTFRYIPKHKETLPYWDENPVILMINRYDNGFLGINFHYLPLDLRIKCLHTLDQQTRPRDLKTLMITWNSIKSSAVARLGEIAVKRYLTTHIRNRPVHIASKNWYLALALPIAKFHKATEEEVGAIARRST